jgi:hypothetical protein
MSIVHESITESHCPSLLNHGTFALAYCPGYAYAKPHDRR